MANTQRKVTDYHITDHGVEHCQYFRGHGISCTKWEDCATGCGETPHEALEDALDCLAQNGWDVESIVNDQPDDEEHTVAHALDLDYDNEEDCETECHWYVSVDVK